MHTIESDRPSSPRHLADDRNDLLEASGDANNKSWQACRFLTCSVLPVQTACNLSCPFCFSRSSLSALRRESAEWRSLDLDRYFEFARQRNANRLVITGGGEPLLRPNEVVDVVTWGRKYFDEIACFTNGTFLTHELSRRLADAGLSYVCYSRHHHDDERCRALMGAGTPRLDEFFRAVGDLNVRATCVMTHGSIDSRERVCNYIDTLSAYGVDEFTFKHTYVAYEHSVFAATNENGWARKHQIEFDPFANVGQVIATLPWGPEIKRIADKQVCYYYEPDPKWEKEHQLCRSVNLLRSGGVYASLEDASSLLFRLTS